MYVCMYVCMYMIDYRIHNAIELYAHYHSLLSFQPVDELDDLRESIVATYLHDEETLFQEDSTGLAKT